MATQHTYTGPAYPPSRAPTDTPLKGRVGILERWRAYSAERERRVLVQWLRRTANRTPDPDPIRRRCDPLLHYRAAAVRTDLLEIAAALERTHNPDPAIVAILNRLAADEPVEPADRLPGLPGRHLPGLPGRPGQRARDPPRRGHPAVPPPGNSPGPGPDRGRVELRQTDQGREGAARGGSEAQDRSRRRARRRHLHRCAPHMPCRPPGQCRATACRSH